MRIDAHVHCWQIGRHGCTWPPAELGPLHRDFVFADWRHEADAAGVDAAIVVQSQACDEDTGWLLGWSANAPRVVGVVGWVDLAGPQAPTRIAALAAYPKLRGLRPMLQDLPDDDWILQRELDPAIEAMLAHGLRFDALVKPRHLPSLVRFARRWPQLPIVIDHAAKPDLAHGVLDPWRADMAALAERPQVCCKLSGLVTEAGGDWRTADFALCIDHLLATFGPQRLLWGSDWPVVNLVSDYRSWHALAARLSGLRDDAYHAVSGGNAARFYGIGH